MIFKCNFRSLKCIKVTFCIDAGMIGLWNVLLIGVLGLHSVIPLAPMLWCSIKVVLKVFALINLYCSIWEFYFFLTSQILGRARTLCQQHMKLICMNWSYLLKGTYALKMILLIWTDNDLKLNSLEKLWQLLQNYWNNPLVLLIIQIYSSVLVQN